MSIISIINQKRRRGDITFVASIVGCDEETVKQMLADPASPKHRNADTKTGKLVVEAFELLFEQRGAFRQKFHGRAKKQLEAA